ncbi:MAG: hypothetical protein M1831_003796 [Alyxoria varia]|nr:MAG: hypothetical protein M1831_003796 [Alyxoria varia]
MAHTPHTVHTPDTHDPHRPRKFRTEKDVYNRVLHDAENFPSSQHLPAPAPDPAPEDVGETPLGVLRRLREWGGRLGVEGEAVRVEARGGYGGHGDVVGEVEEAEKEKEKERRIGREKATGHIVIGYKDFEEVLEKPFCEWVREVSEEEWVPWHRVRWFVRRWVWYVRDGDELKVGNKGDGEEWESGCDGGGGDGAAADGRNRTRFVRMHEDEVLWNREERIDNVFGS